MKLETNRVGRERPTCQPRPFDRALALFDPLFARATLVVESNDAFCWAAHVGNYKADTRIKFARMPFDLGDDPAGFCPSPGLIGEVGIGAPHFVRRPPNRARQQMADPFLQDAVRWQPYCVFDPLGFEKLINFGIGETRVGPEINARDLPLVAFDNRLQHTVPLWTLPGRSEHRSRSPNWLNTK